MTQLIVSDSYSVILGLGKTGLSVARYFGRRGHRCVVIDTRLNPPGLQELKAEQPDTLVFLGETDESLNDFILAASQVVISPGISRSLPLAQVAINNSIPLVGDVDLFLQEVQVPTIGITGSNGKTTVATLMGNIATRAGIKTSVAGNIGIPVLDTLDMDVELYVLELSSFQLESVRRPDLTVACVLNVTEDHMDRYTSLASYCMAKQRIYWGAKNVVYNLDDKLTVPPIIAGVQRSGFGFGQHHEQGDIKYLYDAVTKTLSRQGETLLDRAEIRMFGRHNVANALALMALCDAAEIDLKYCFAELEEFVGLPHRCQWVANHNQVTFINDSKATNVGASTAAVVGIKDDFNGVVIIAGGDSKGADFSVFGRVLAEQVAAVVLIGRDAEQIAAALPATVMVVKCASLDDAVEQAYQLSKSGGAVLLSPACASFDMFKGFEDRGEQFVRCVARLAA